MTQQKITNPHDAFAKKVMAVRANALDFFQGVLPDTIKEHLNFSAFRRDPTSYVDNSLAESFSDIVYTCRTKDNTPVKISLLFEHKSFSPQYPHFQLLRYKLGIWDASIADNLQPPLVIAVVLYHGKENWKEGSMYTYFGPADKHVQKYIPNFEYILLNLSGVPDEELKEKLFNRVAVKIWLLVQKNIFHPKKLIKHLRDFLKLGILYVQEEEGIRFFEWVFRYIFAATDIPPKEVLKTVEQLPQNVEEAAMTTVERIREEEAKKYKKVQKEYRQRTIQKMLEKNYPLTDISEITGLSIEEITKMKK